MDHRIHEGEKDPHVQPTSKEQIRKEKSKEIEAISERLNTLQNLETELKKLLVLKS